VRPLRPLARAGLAALTLASAAPAQTPREVYSVQGRIRAHQTIPRPGGEAVSRVRILIDTDATVAHNLVDGSFKELYDEALASAAITISPGLRRPGGIDLPQGERPGSLLAKKPGRRKAPAGRFRGKLALVQRFGHPWATEDNQWVVGELCLESLEVGKQAWSAEEGACEGIFREPQGPVPGADAPPDPGADPLPPEPEPAPAPEQGQGPAEPRPPRRVTRSGVLRDGRTGRCQDPAFLRTKDSAVCQGQARFLVGRLPVRPRPPLTAARLEGAYGSRVELAGELDPGGGSPRRSTPRLGSKASGPASASAPTPTRGPSRSGGWRENGPTWPRTR